MGSIKRMTGTSWHVNILSKKEEDNRRHKSRCVYYQGVNKYCTYYCMNCKGSNTCDKYEERPNTKKNISEEKKQPKISISSTIEENTNIVGKKFEEKRRQTINDV